jgi:hypothetical protein
VHAPRATRSRIRRESCSELKKRRATRQREMARTLLQLDEMWTELVGAVARASLSEAFKEAFSVPIVTVAVPDVEIVDGEIAQSDEAKVDGTEQESVTVPVNEFKAATVSVVVAEALRLTVSEAGLTES